jgi:hypothetical protein
MKINDIWTSNIYYANRHWFWGDEALKYFDGQDYYINDLLYCKISKLQLSDF